jgi:hypothetical protein
MFLKTSDWWNCKRALGPYGLAMSAFKDFTSGDTQFLKSLHASLLQLTQHLPLFSSMNKTTEKVSNGLSISYLF